MQRGEFRAVPGWHRTGTPGCYESDDRKAGVEKINRENRWKLWVHVGPQRWQFKHVGTYPTRNAAMRAYQPNAHSELSAAPADKLQCDVGNLNGGDE